MSAALLLDSCFGGGDGCGGGYYGGGEEVGRLLTITKNPGALSNQGKLSGICLFNTAYSSTGTSFSISRISRAGMPPTMRYSRACAFSALDALGRAPENRIAMVEKAQHNHAKTKTADAITNRHRLFYVDAYCGGEAITRHISRPPPTAPLYCYIRQFRI